MRFTIITFRLQVLRQGGVTVCVGVCGHLNCNLRRQSGVSSVALVRGEVSGAFTALKWLGSLLAEVPRVPNTCGPFNIR